MQLIPLPLSALRGMSLADARLSALQGGWQQIQARADEIAAGSSDVEQLHQLRVALRRLRSLQRFLATPGREAPPWVPAAAGLLRRLGVARDRDVVDTVLLPRVRAAYAGVCAVAEAPPPGAWLVAKSGDDPTPAELLRSKDSQRLLGELRKTLAEPETGTPAKDHGLERLATHRLERWHRRVLAGVGRFADLDEAGRHALRKRIKRLRYAAEWVAPLFPRRRVRRYLTALNEAQACLGEISDAAAACRVFSGQAATNPLALFALGWLAAHRESLLAAAPARLAGFSGVRRFW